MPTKEQRRMIGELFVVGFDGRSVSREVRKFIEEYRLKGAILFQRNSSEVVQTWELVRDLRKLGLRVGIDHEGGRVNRLPEPVTPTPPLAGLGLARSERLGEELGRLHGRELAALGFQINYSPCLDVLSNPLNRVIGDRSIGSDPRVVGELGAAYIRGLQSEGLAACGKHYPGHGATREDSHVSLPEVGLDRTTLDGVHRGPFQQAARAGVAMLMTAHVRFTGLDPDRPATLSRKVLTSLREEFDRPIVTDDLQMAALNRWSMDERVLLALEAGVDQLMICHDLDQQVLAVETLYKAVDGRILKPARLEESSRRIKTLKACCSASPAPNREALLAILGCDAHLETAFSIPSN